MGEQIANFFGQPLVQFLITMVLIAAILKFFMDRDK